MEDKKLFNLGSSCDHLLLNTIAGMPIGMPKILEDKKINKAPYMMGAVIFSIDDLVSQGGRE